MIEKSHASKTLGLELTSTSVKAAELSLKKGQPQVNRLFQFNLINQNLTEDELKKFDLSGNTLIVTATEGGETLVRPLEIKLKKEKDINTVLPFQSEPLLPYPVDTAILDRLIVSKGTDGTQLSVLAIKKEHLQRHLDRYKQLCIEPEVVASTPSALIAFSNYFLPKEITSYFVLHLGEEQTCCSFAKEGKLIASKSSQYCLNTLKQAFQKDSGIADEEALEKAFSELDWSRIELLGLSLTLQALKDFAAELEKVVFSLMKQIRELSVPPLLVTGEGAQSEALTAFLLKDMRGNLLALDASSSDKFTDSELKKFALPIGEALTGLNNYSDQINFLQGDFVYPHPWKRLMTPVQTFLGLSLALAFAFYLFSHAYIKNRENSLRGEYADLLKVSHKSYPIFEQEIQEKYPHANSEEGKIPPIESLTQEEIAFRANLIQKELQAVPDVYPLMPNIPKVSDLLAWLSTHPNIVNKEGGKPYIDIEAIHYAVSKRPELAKKNEKYQVKVELDFTSANATAAREFHDAMLAPNDFVDPKGEVKWTNNKGRYRATFFLKDRTVYP